ncbi:MAG: NUDIX hydrolase [Omnitrophica WOR_2 bacterium]
MLIPRTLIFLTRGNKVLLLKGAPSKRLWANRYNGVGGHIERGEDVLTAGHRELLEETGLTAPDLRLYGTVTVDAGPDVGVGIYILRGECPDGEPVNSKEGCLEWVDIPDIRNLPLVEDLYVLLPRLLSMEPSDPPFSAHYSYDERDRLIIAFG